MIDPDFLRLVDEAAKVLGERSLRVRTLPEGSPAVFVGDTHGDSDATERILERFPPHRFMLVFLGDYVDRGPDSLGNVRLLLSTKLTHPDRVILLAGNHEGWNVSPFCPADFWQGLPEEVASHLGRMLLRLPLAAWHPQGVLAVHGGLPEIDSLDGFAGIESGDESWRRVTWGDWREDGSADSVWSSRPSLGREVFERVTKRLGVKVLVRSHQPSAPMYLYGDRCMTLFTSCAYGNGGRQVAVLQPGRVVHTARDLDLIDI